MKQCPACSRTYADDTLAYCLDDGAALVAKYDAQATLRIPAPRVTDMPATQVSPLQTPIRSTLQRSSSWPIYVFVAALLLVVGGVVVTLLIFGYSRIATSSSTNTNPPSETKGGAPQSPSPSSPTANSLVGTWQTNVFENGQNQEITVTFTADGATRYLIKDAQGRKATDYGTWQYSDGTLFERFSNGASGKGSIRWIDQDTVELTIIDNGVPAYSGLKRIYRRIS